MADTYLSDDEKLEFQDKSSDMDVSAIPPGVTFKESPDPLRMKLIGDKRQQEALKKNTLLRDEFQKIFSEE